MKSNLFIIFILLSLNASSQKRIGLDVSSHLLNINTTLHYQQVLKNRLLWSFGIFRGGMGKTITDGDTLNIYEGTNYSPYSSVNQPFVDSSGTHNLLGYSMRGKANGLQAGLGCFLPLGPKHGLRTNINFKVGYISTRVVARYKLTPSHNPVSLLSFNNHWFAGVSTEIYHTIRLIKRFTFYYGLKVPYYFSINKGRFNPLHKSDMLYGFEPEISLGLTRVIGKCD
ncbi:MAG: hypothetical protein ACI865_000694 [Flavobacteriaceae bacterium]